MTTARADLPTITIRRGPEATTVVRVIARVVLAMGLLVAGFVVYEFGVTSLMATRAQAGLGEQLDARIATVEVTATAYEPTTALPAPFPAPVDPTAVSPAVAAGESPSVFTEPLPAPGEPMGRISIPVAGVSWTFVEGVTRADLESGAGHMTGTAIPGQAGNAVISGHRTTHGAPFLHLDRVVVGDLITVETATGTHVYQVVEKMVVDPSDVWVTDQWDGAWLTLTTCEPVLSASQRLVVVAALVDGPNAGVILGGS